MTADSRVAPGTPTRTRQPRADAADTREALLSSGARLIARHGLGVPVTQIQDAAAQRNKSAVRYHFGSVLELALAVTARHGHQVDARRAEALDAFHERYAPPAPTTAARTPNWPPSSTSSSAPRPRSCTPRKAATTCACSRRCPTWPKSARARPRPRPPSCAPWPCSGTTSTTPACPTSTNASPSPSRCTPR
ncbi:TetR/AcrR family transcriptional regulator [Yinghuangia aomiensis]